MAPRAGTLLLVLVFSGCGNDSPRGPASPATPDVPVQQCRRYATALTNVSTTFVTGQQIGSEESGACTFDRTSATLRCTYTGSAPDCAGSRTTSTVYASVVDFVEEAAVVGRFRHQRLVMQISGCPGSSNSTESNTYDGTKRPLTRQFANSQGVRASSTFTAWDALGRQTREMADTTTCTQSRWVSTYDDTARTWTSRLTEAGAGRGCLSDYALTTAYDSSGNIVREVTTLHGVKTWSLTSTITSTDTVCF